MMLDVWGRPLEFLEDTLRHTEADWGTATILDYAGVTGFPECPGTPAIEVTSEKVQDAALRFRGRCVTVLNFASGVSPGGGVRGGARAQEEVLCLCSGLLHGLEASTEFYDRNLDEDAPAESHDLMIWSEDVPLVRDGNFAWVDPMRMNVITYPAPNNRRLIVDPPGIFNRRCRHVVRKAAKAGTEVLILGAWGCGEYANNPEIVANAFKAAIASQSGQIERVVFAVYGNARNLDVFRRVLA